MLKEKKDKEDNAEQEENIVNKQETLTTPDSGTEVIVPVIVYMGHGTPVTSGTSTPVAPINTPSTAAGNLDVNTVNLFQQLLMQ